MKDKKKAFRRQKSQDVLEKRARKNYHWLANPKTKSWAEFWDDTKSGKSNTWMRSMSTACSCFICSGSYKYVRPDKGLLEKGIYAEIQEKKHYDEQETDQAHLSRKLFV